MQPPDARQAAALAQGLDALGLSLDGPQCDRLLAYLSLVAKWNRVYNLTAVRQSDDMLSLHLLDSLSAVLPLRQRLGAQAGLRVLDVGSGAGLPGVVFAIVRPDLQVTCVDAVGKKAAFIRQAALELKLGNLSAEHARVEQLQPQAADLIVSRAFASLVDFTAWTREHLKPEGIWMAMKGKNPADEIAALPSSIAVFHVEHLQVPGLEAERCLVWMKPTAV